MDPKFVAPALFLPALPVPVRPSSARLHSVDYPRKRVRQRTARGGASTYNPFKQQNPLFRPKRFLTLALPGGSVAMRMLRRLLLCFCVGLATLACSNANRDGGPAAAPQPVPPQAGRLP